MSTLGLDVLMALYLGAGLLGLVGFLPQMKSLATSREAARHAPLLTWLLWTVQTLIYLLYAAVVNGDPLFIVVAGFSFAATALCLGLLLWQRRGAPSLPARRATDTLPPGEPPFRY